MPLTLELTAATHSRAHCSHSLYSSLLPLTPQLTGSAHSTSDRCCAGPLQLTHICLTAVTVFHQLITGVKTDEERQSVHTIKDDLHDVAPGVAVEVVAGEVTLQHPQVLAPQPLHAPPATMTQSFHSGTFVS